MCANMCFQTSVPLSTCSGSEGASAIFLNKPSTSEVADGKKQHLCTCWDGEGGTLPTLLDHFSWQQQQLSQAITDVAAKNCCVPFQRSVFCCIYFTSLYAIVTTLHESISEESREACASHIPRAKGRCALKALNVWSMAATVAKDPQSVPLNSRTRPLSETCAACCFSRTSPSPQF